jgi:hypothetical protein
MFFTKLKPPNRLVHSWNQQLAMLTPDFLMLSSSGRSLHWIPLSCLLSFESQFQISLLRREMESARKERQPARCEVQWGSQ